MALTDSKLKALNGRKHDKPPMKIADRDGLSVYHRKTGRLSFVFRYRYNHKPQDITLGSYPMMSLGEARGEAIKCRKILADGQDPKLTRQLDKEKLLHSVSVQNALNYWIEGHASKKRTNYLKHKAQFEKHIYPRIGHLPLELCETRHWVKVFDDITNGTYHRPAPKASGYILRNCKHALKFCRIRQYAISSALDDLEVEVIGENQSKGDRILTWTELMDVWAWTQDIRANRYYRNLIHLLVVFGCRTQELRLSKIKEWDLEEMIWTTPKANSKTGQEIKRPIPNSIKGYIKALQEQSQSDLLLGDLKTPEAVSVYGRSIFKKLGHKSPWTLHDIRRTFSTMLNDMEIEPYVVEQLLGHALGGVMGIYNKSSHIEQKRVALDIWILKLDETATGSNVVEIR
ncbi:tyrosine-type recombinase/integrase [Vibrio breoganii]